MTATSFLLFQALATVLLLWWAWEQVRPNLPALTRAVLFNLSAVFLFDYLANDRQIWSLPPSWSHYLLKNPLENSVFTALMTLHLVVLLAILEARTANSNH